MKIKVNIPGFGERYCSNNCEFFTGYSDYIIVKKESDCWHNEYGPAYEDENGYCEYWINGKLHRLSDINCFYEKKQYFVFGKSLGYTKNQFTHSLANILIPKC